ncbi:MAG: AtzE family amidohydrolase [Sphingobium sp.]|nr:AtzE family amidohydrolase [Sphingobium sp.]
MPVPPQGARNERRTTPLPSPRAVRDGDVERAPRCEACLDRIDATDAAGQRLHRRAGRTRAEARRRSIDVPPAARASMPLAGVPFAVKNLFDIAGLPTLAGSKIEASRAPAARDALLVRRLEAEGAVLVGALNMDEYAYGFTTENTHYGPTRNPHDLTRIAGGSSGGSAAAVAAGQVPLTLGSDTNGSIRVPASLCGVFGLKPTFGRLPRTGSYPFVASLDHLGPFARSVRDLALCYDAMQGPLLGPPSDDPACAQRPLAAHAAAAGRKGAQGLRIAVLGGWFREMALAEATAAVDAVAQALGTTRLIELPEVERARAAAFLITNAEGAALHLPDLRSRAQDFEPLSRDRFLAGALLPAAWVQQAQRVRHWFARRVARVFENVDVLIAPATPCVAPLIGTEWLQIGQRLPARPSMGLLTQPISCIGLPVVTVPLWGMSAAPAPAGGRADHRRALARRPGAARGRTTAGRTACAARRWPRSPVAMDLNRPEVLTEMQAVFARYEDALVHNRIDELDALFWDSAQTVRYGAGENLRGIDAIRAFRAARAATGLTRTLQHTVITTYGHDFATAMTEFHRDGGARIGRQSQTWCRIDGRWVVVAAHVSLIVYTALTGELRVPCTPPKEP